MLFSLHNILLLLAVSLLPRAQSQLLNVLPRCIRDCINQSQYSNCQITDVACLCRASSGNFLPALVTCMHEDCIDIDSDVLLAPLEFACELAGAPIPDSALENARNQNESGGGGEPVTKTVTLGDEGYTRISTATVTTTIDDITQILVYPITIERTTTVSGSPSTITAKPTEDSSAASSESTHTDEANSSSSASAQASITDTTSEEGTTTIYTTISSTPTVAGTLVTSTNPAESSGVSETSSEQPASETNTFPFEDRNNSASKALVGTSAVLGGLFFWACAWA